MDSSLSVVAPEVPFENVFLVRLLLEKRQKDPRFQPGLQLLFLQRTLPTPNGSLTLPCFVPLHMGDVFSSPLCHRLYPVAFNRSAHLQCSKRAHSAP